MNNAYGLDASYFINLFARELNPDVVRNQTPDCLARVLARAARTACAEVLAEEEFQFSHLHRPGQIKEGDEIRFTLAGKVIDATAVLVLNPGTDKEEVVYNRKKNHYFNTAMVVDGTSSHKRVLIRIKPGAGPEGIVGAGITWKAQGDANEYVLMKDGDWFAAVRMNGQMYVHHQELFLNSLFQTADK